MALAILHRRTPPTNKWHWRNFSAMPTPSSAFFDNDLDSGFAVTRSHPHAVHDPQTRQTIVRLLSSMGSAKEISQYLKRFSQLDAARLRWSRWAAQCCAMTFDALVSSLAFLQTWA